MNKSRTIPLLVLALILGLLLPSRLCASMPVFTPESEFDAFMTGYMKALLAAFDEKDEKKSVLLLRQLQTDLLPRFYTLLPEVKAWIKSMSQAEIEAWRTRAESKSWIKDIMTFGFTAAYQQRIEKNPYIRKEMHELNKAFKELRAGGEEAKKREIAPGSDR